MQSSKPLMYKLLVPVVLLGLLGVGLSYLADANHSAPSNLEFPYYGRCNNTNDWPASNPSGPTQTGMTLDFSSNADVYASDYYIGGNGTAEDPALIHVPGCLQLFIRVTGVQDHVEFVDMAYWVMNPPSASVASSMDLPSECMARDSVFCIHDNAGLVSIRDFFLDHGGVLFNVKNATLHLEQSTWEEVAEAGTPGDVHADGVVEFHQVFWYGIEGPTNVLGGDVKVMLSSLHGAASTCMPTLAFVPVSPPPLFALPLEDAAAEPAGMLAGVTDPVLGDVGVPSWIGRGVDELGSVTF